MFHATKTFQQQAAVPKERLHQFLAEMGQSPLPLPDARAVALEANVWAETACLTCANCCRRMSPAYTAQDIKRLATHFRMTVRAFKEKWLYQNAAGAWMNRSQPCPFLDLDTNKCTVYALRPDDCAGFPHLAKKPMEAYLHVHRQNIQYCPATFKFLEKLMQEAGADL